MDDIKEKANTPGETRERRRGRPVLIAALIAVPLLVAAGFLLFPRVTERLAEPSPTPEYSLWTLDFIEKAEALRLEVFGGDGEAAEGAESIPGVGYISFLSISDGESRAQVFSGVGETPDASWEAAQRGCESFVEAAGYAVKWLRADLVSDSRLVSPEDLAALISADEDSYFRCGIALDKGYTQALLEAELNGCGIYDYENKGLDLSALNARLINRGAETVAEIPRELRIFRSRGWFMDEDGGIYPLTGESEGGSGRRALGKVDGGTALTLAQNAARYIIPHTGKNGGFRYGVYPCTGEEIEGYSSLLHASTLWSLELIYGAGGDGELLEVIDRAAEKLISYVRLADDGAGYLYEPAWDEVKTGGAGLALVALTEYMDIRDSEEYLDEAIALGNGLIAMQDEWTGQFWHIADGSLRPTVQTAQPYYDGAAVFGLARLYGLDGDPKWLNAARLGMDYMITNDYSVHADQWASYAALELTKYLSYERYYTFGVQNAWDNLRKLSSEEGTAPENLELLMAAFELYEQARGKNIPMPMDFDLQALLDAIYLRAERLLDGYFFPECAMYMKNPARVLDSFMLWDGVCRARIDDLQHNICAYYYYYKNYDALVAAGMGTGE